MIHKNQLPCMLRSNKIFHACHKTFHAWRKIFYACYKIPERKLLLREMALLTEMHLECQGDDSGDSTGRICTGADILVAVIRLSVWCSYCMRP